MISEDMQCQMILYRSVGTLVDEQYPQQEQDVMCSNCFDQTDDLSKSLSEFVAIAGADETVYDVKTEDDFAAASKLTGTPLTAEDFKEENSLPIVCSSCNETVGMVDFTRLEQHIEE